ncbi:DUF4412 domain-containing protein [Parapedobacter sp. 10938]|uniref:DUF4412 domain-containing protein n=1 Tax=Parapedobacter flavus TaxID=3110225 RepID=UPI002DB732A3|nr:DUF4412 domain-containing protein [Parapedobacter sp. 10938]MEC3880377.1 DUF4412 domain-containing protein [Parapedobacter sp. 10938]
MNYKAIVLILAVAVGGMETANGQFLKKLGKKVEKAAERTVERRAERETEKKTDQALDKILEPGDKKGKKEKGETKGKAASEGSDSAEESNAAVARGQAALAAMLGGGSMEDVPDTYTFSYRATMKIIHDDAKEETAMQYWLEPEATYFGTKVLMEGAANNLAVMDMENKAMVMFMDDGDRKTAMRLNGSQEVMDKYLKFAVESEEDEEVKVTPIESKTILGYHCKGFQMETSDGVSKVWVTEEAPVGLFSGMFQTDNVPEGMPDFGAKALFMEMEYLPKDGQDDPYRMICTELKQESLAIHKKDYQSAI